MACSRSWPRPFTRPGHDARNDLHRRLNYGWHAERLLLRLQCAYVLRSGAWMLVLRPSTYATCTRSGNKWLPLSRLPDQEARAARRPCQYHHGLRPLELIEPGWHGSVRFGALEHILQPGQRQTPMTLLRQVPTGDQNGLPPNLRSALLLAYHQARQRGAGP
jgi:hypothetical protein